MEAWDDHTNQLSISGPEGELTCEAVYTITVNIHRGKIEEVVRAELIEWTFDGRILDRPLAAAILGRDEVKRQEELVRKELAERPDDDWFFRLEAA